MRFRTTVEIEVEVETTYASKGEEPSEFSPGSPDEVEWEAYAVINIGSGKCKLVKLPDEVSRILDLESECLEHIKEGHHGSEV